MTRAVQTRQTEAAFQRMVVGYARLFNWRVAHFRAGLNRRGAWATPVAADGAGFPDLVLVRERVAFVELKADGGRLRPEQKAWRLALAAAGAEYHCWRPGDWPEIERVLGR